MNGYQICKNCIMDTSDPKISFDSEGICNHCLKFKKDFSKIGYHGEKSDKKLNEIIDQIKSSQKNKEYDCIVGISGGVDSAFVAYLARQFDLRILAIHVDAGWNSQIAVENIQKICKSLNIDLHTVVVDWQTMKELQRAYMFSGLPDLDVPQDHVFFASIYKFARKYGVKYVLTGGNIATEGILPSAWGYSPIDYRSIKDVYKKNGRGRISLRKYPHYSLLEYIYYQYRLKIIRPLNYINYSKKMAIQTLEEQFDWKYYGGKHYESRFTKFFQAYYLPVKFGFDKKRAHLSSLIVNNEITRDEALRLLKDQSEYTQEQILEDRDYILKKLDITMEEWEKIICGPKKTEDDYKNNKKRLKYLLTIKTYLGK